jgi:hypothetical protein
MPCFCLFYFNDFCAFIFLKYTQWQCISSYDNSTAMYKFPKTLHAGGIRTRDLLFCRRTRCLFIFFPSPLSMLPPWNQNQTHDCRVTPKSSCLTCMMEGGGGILGSRHFRSSCHTVDNSLHNLNPDWIKSQSRAKWASGLFWNDVILKSTKLMLSNGALKRNNRYNKTMLICTVMHPYIHTKISTQWLHGNYDRM